MPSLSKPKCKISLIQRPFSTVPYLGRGKSNPVLESHLPDPWFWIIIKFIVAVILVV